VSIVGLKSQSPASFDVTKLGASKATIAKDEFVAYTGVQKDTSVVENAEIVFVGYGIQAPEYQWDDYKGLDKTGALRGKVLLMMNNDPDDASDPSLFKGKTRLYYGRWDYKYESAARAGALAAIIIHTTPSAGYPWAVVQTSWSAEQFELAGETGPRLTVRAWVTEDAAARIATLAGKDLKALWQAAQKRDFQPVPLGVTTSLVLKNQIATKTTANVIAKWTGSDETLRNEAVLYTAHHDHLGRADLGAGANGRPKDGIFNGAQDNAVGVAGVLAIAEQVAQMADRPKRTMYFATVAAEEKGLLGSKYLAQNLPLPAGRVAANVNIDGANIWGRARDLPMIGFGKSSLDATIVSLAAMQGRTVVPDQEPDKGFFYRSDQFNFAKIGIPAAYFHAGADIIGKPAGWGRAQRDIWTAKDYHQPTDEIAEWWNFAGALDDLRLCLLLGIHVANAPEMPRWNPGDEFEGARRKAIAEAAGK
jgi:Zn-dependent M28 family amino/carboxypeptidase